MDANDASSPEPLWRGAIVLAAGRGVRMRSATPKVLHCVGGVPMIRRAINALVAAGVNEIVVVLDSARGLVRDAVAAQVVTVEPDATPTADDIRIGVQVEPRGTADATRVGMAAFSRPPDTVVVIGGDTPLLTAATVAALIAETPRATIAMAVAERDQPVGYGRVVLDAGGRVSRIVEEADGTPEERSIRLVNGMAFAFDGDWLRSRLPEVRPAPNGEYYLTALVARAVADGREVSAVHTTDQWEIMGVNTRRELAQAEAACRMRILLRLMDSGVTILDPASTYVDETVVVGQDTEIHPQTFLKGGTIIGENCVIGPGATIVNSQVGAGSVIWWSVIEGVETGTNVRVGPYARIRPDTVLGDSVSLGSFAEVKNSRLGANTQMHHFSYVGDAEIGARVNLGAGMVTCNFDGETKHRTIVENDAFVGSDTMLVAPVRIGAGAATGAGAVVTRDIPAGSVAYGVPARIHPSRAVDPGMSQENHAS